jgi:hypothetical protein
MLGAEGAKIVAEAIKVRKCTPAIILAHFHAHLTSQSTAVVCYYPQDMGAMTSLNLASNQLGAKGAKVVAEAIKVMPRDPHVAPILGPQRDIFEAPNR